MKISKEMENKILKRIKDGDKNYRELGEEFGYNKATIAQIARRHGIQVKKSARPLTDEEIKKIIYEVEKGEKEYQKIADEIGVSVSCISQTAIKYGIRRKKEGKRRSEIAKITPEIEQKVLKLIKEGKIAYNDIGNEVGISRQSVNTIAKRNGIVREQEKRNEMAAKKFNEKYGTINILSIKEIKDKAEKTMLDKYGVKYPIQSKQILEKMQQTNMERYGAKCSFQNEKVKEKWKKNFIEKYGVDNPMKLEENKEKAKKECKRTNLERYGVEWTTLLPQCSFKGSNSKPNKEFEKKLDLQKISFQREYSLIKYRYDFKINNVLVEINPTITHNSTLNVYKTDKNTKIILPEKYHYNKSRLAAEKGFHCIHIWDWDDQDKIIKLFLQPKTKIYARDCKIVEISKEKADTFLELNHLQGKCRGNEINIGLFYNNEIVEIMTFGSPRYNKNYEYELLRLCSSKVVIGGSERIFKYFLEKYKPKSVISYCDYSKFNGDVYKKLGFKLIRHKIGKHWYNLKTNQHITDNLLRQRGFDQLFDAAYGKGTSNTELMKQHNFVEVYDAGQQTWVIQFDTKK